MRSLHEIFSPAMTFTLRGECHCGNVAVTLDTAVDPGALPLRACQCSFCRRHGARVTTDPAGLLKISVRDPAILLRYRFGLGITDFLVSRSRRRLAICRRGFWGSAAARRTS
jgi:hypothetical protein